MGSSNEPVIRKLTKDERDAWANAVVKAIEAIPAFRDAVALLSPFWDGSAETAYTDRYARCGFGPWFLEQDPMVQAEVVLHECMHILNNHFARAEDIGGRMDQVSNLAGDFEINSALVTHPRIQMDMGVLPDKEPFSYPRSLSFEQYYALLRNDQKKQQQEQNQSGDGSGSRGEPGGSGESKGADGGEIGGHQHGNGKGCDQPTEERTAAADEAGVERASAAEQSIARKNTAARVVEEIKQSRQRGSGSALEFFELANKMLAPAKVPWQTLLRNVVARSADAITRGRTDYSYRRVNRRSHGSPFVFPGMAKYVPSMMLAIDTSGSMSGDDYRALLSEAEGVIKSASSGKNGLTVFTVDTKTSGMQTVGSARDIKLTGGGGTDMSIAVQLVNELPARSRPDIFILATDGYTDWEAYEDRLREGRGRYRHIILVTESGGFRGMPEGVRQLATVLDISGE